MIGSAIGETATLYSFYDTDSATWEINAKIDPNDASGIGFLKEIQGEDPFSYVFDKGREYHLYDFKHSNNDPSHVGKENALSDTNRGMPIGHNKSGTTVFASARDIGNIGAGIVAKNARTGLLVARLGFDGYQTIQNIKNGGKLRWSIEGKTTRSAQMYGLSRSGKIKRDIQRYEKSH